MLAWLNRNAPAVQATAAIVSVLLTMVLVWITGRYVKLTRQLAGAARAQIRYQEQSAASDAARLLTLVNVFRLALKNCPTTEKERERIRDLALWKHGDVSTLAALAPSVLGADVRVHHIVQKLNWIRDRADQIQQATDDVERVWSQFPWSQWGRDVGETQTELDRLHQTVKGLTANDSITSSNDSAVSAHSHERGALTR